MNDLPTPASGSAPSPVGVSTGSISKEVEAGRSPVEVPLRPIEQEVKLSPDVVVSGVKLQPTSIPVPPPVVQMGVKPAGQNIPATTPTVVLPLSDDQIAQGLKKSMWDSWRWLAQWCIRRLKQAHMGLKNVHGRFIRVKQ